MKSLPVRFLAAVGLAGCLLASAPAAPSPAAEAAPGPGAPAVDYVRFTLANHPAARASWHEWRAAVAAVAPAGALPDPQLTFEADIAGMLMSLMPGVMFDLMAPGKRAAMSREAAAAAEVIHRRHRAELVRLGAETRRALVELAFLDESLALSEAGLAARAQQVHLARAAYTTDRGMDASLDAAIRAADELERARNERDRLDLQRAAARARLKAALGLAPGAPDPAWPSAALSRTELPAADALWARLQEANAELAAMRAMVEMAVAEEAVARRSRTPDFTAGLMADVKAAPWMWRPTATLTLPIWRSKIAGLVEAARSRRAAAAARVEGETLAMAAELARMLAMVGEADRMIEYIDRSALPAVRGRRETAAAAYRSGAGAPAMIAEMATMELAMRTERLAALRERELAAVALLAMAAGDTVAAGTDGDFQP